MQAAGGMWLNRAVSAGMAGAHRNQQHAVFGGCRRRRDGARCRAGGAAEQGRGRAPHHPGEWPEQAPVSDITCRDPAMTGYSLMTKAFHSSNDAVCLQKHPFWPGWSQSGTPLQVYCLERLAAGDTATARSLLAAMVQARLLWRAPSPHASTPAKWDVTPCSATADHARPCLVHKCPQPPAAEGDVPEAGPMPDQALERMSDKALPEWAPFAATLAQRLARLVAAGQLAPGQPLWGLAVERLLLRAVDTEGQVRL